MIRLYNEIINMSLTACWMILAVLMLRLILKRAPKFIFCIMWSLIGLRLIIPVTFESNLSLIPSSEIVEIEPDTAAEVSVDTGIDTVDNSVNGIISENNKTYYSANPSQIWVPVTMIVWLSVFFVMILYYIISYVLIKNKVREAVLYQKNIYQSERIKVPFILGTVRPRIYIPYTLEKEALDCVIAHEKSHIRRLDHISKPLWFIILAIHWFNPFVWLSYVMFCRDMEQACDESVLKNNRIDKKVYSSTLLKCSLSESKKLFCPPAFGEVGVKQRVKNILNFKTPAIWIVIVSVVICVLILVAFMTNPIDKNRSLPLEGEIDIINVSPIDSEYYEAIRGDLFDENQLNRILSGEVALDKPPKLYLTDIFSSSTNQFEVPQLGTYNWSVKEVKDQWNSVVACGSGPFELAKECRRLTVTRYNKLVKTPYIMFFEIEPTSITLDEYNMPVSWDNDQVLVSQTVYNKDEVFMLELEKGKIYHIKAEWSKEMFERFGFYGEAEYILVTQ